MPFFDRFAGGLRALLFRRRAERELDEELRAYLDEAVDREVSVGRSPADARRRVRLEHGPVDAIKDGIRDAGWESFALSMAQDVRYAVRTLVRTPMFTAAALLTLALGIGATTAIYSVVQALLLRSLPYAQPERIVRISEEASSPEAQDPVVRPVGLSKQEMEALRTSSWTLSHVGSYLPASVTMSGSEGAVRMEGMQLSPAVMAMLGVPPLLGRVFEPREENPLDTVIVLSFGTWQRRFGGDPGLVGSTIAINGQSYEVIGVMPQGFYFPTRDAEFWIPLAFPRGARLVITARVRNGVPLEAAREELSALLGRIRTTSRYPAPPPPPPPPGRRLTPEEVMALPPAHIAGRAEDVRITVPAEPPRVRLVPLHDHIIGSTRTALLILMGAGVCVLFIACANVSTLLLARGSTRRREIATRLALGAGRGRIVRQLVTEGLVLAFAGGGAGIALALGGVRLLQYMGAALPPQGFGPSLGLPRVDEIGVDAGVLVFAAGMTCAAGLAAALWPAAQQTRRADGDPLREGSGTTSASPLQLRGRRTGGVLVMLQMCLATVLLVSGALLARGFVSVTSVSPGYDVENVLAFQVILPAGANAGMIRDELLERLSALPGVQAATFTDRLPMSTGGSVVHLRTSPAPVAGPPPPPPPGASMRPEFPTLRTVGPGYLDVLGIAVREGRGFSKEAWQGAPREALISRSLAESGYLGARPVGTLVYLNAPAPLEVVGVIDDLRLFGLDQAPGPQLFVRAGEGLPPAGAGAPPLGTRPGATLPAYMVRFDGDPQRVADGVRGAVRAVHPGATVDRVATLAEIVSNTLVRPRLYTALLAVFAGLAALLAIVGVYGLVAYSVRGRIREIGVRMTFGATPRDIGRLVVGQGMLLACLGIVAGLAGAAAASRYLAAMLYGISPLDAATYGGVAATFALVAFAACWLPASAAARVDPAKTLRGE